MHFHVRYIFAPASLLPSTPHQGVLRPKDVLGEAGLPEHGLAMQDQEGERGPAPKLVGEEPHPFRHLENEDGRLVVDTATVALDGKVRCAPLSFSM